ncbi:hypothetical protein VIGAN_02164500 [Vigna angularis var. angularis]|uniref:Uncharacterized protein n=1 Tax=Vigna angularis var. angularis TaxID=157739 RepID=A0A0S3REB5_PHAAN|nr:hypothetical protein VIGAN_02164500 [Vigna angularis var. angularis]
MNKIRKLSSFEGNAAWSKEIDNIYNSTFTSDHSDAIILYYICRLCFVSSDQASFPSITASITKITILSRRLFAVSSGSPPSFSHPQSTRMTPQTLQGAPSQRRRSCRRRSGGEI